MVLPNLCHLETNVICLWLPHLVHCLVTYVLILVHRLSDVDVIIFDILRIYIKDKERIGKESP